jgi:hypothetical protein
MNIHEWCEATKGISTLREKRYKINGLCDFFVLATRGISKSHKGTIEAGKWRVSVTMLKRDGLEIPINMFMKFVRKEEPFFSYAKDLIQKARIRNE